MFKNPLSLIFYLLVGAVLIGFMVALPTEPWLWLALFIWFLGLVQGVHYLFTNPSDA